MGQRGRPKKEKVEIEKKEKPHKLVSITAYHKEGIKKKQEKLSEYKTNRERYEEENRKEYAIEKRVIENKDKNEYKSLLRNMDEVSRTALFRELEKKSATFSYENYCQYVTYGIFKPHKFHKYLCRLLDRVIEKVENGDNVRIMLSVPPRSGKSFTTTETFPSYVLGRHPDWPVILTSCGADLAEDFGDKNRQKIAQFGEELFGIRLSDSQNTKGNFKVQIKDNKGTYITKSGCISVGVGGQITGRGAKIVIIDDPFKNEKEVSRKGTRDDVWSHWTSSIATRLQGNGNAVIVIMTRWHDDDLIGRLLKQKDENGKNEWIYIKMPAVCEDEENDLLKRKKGETLCPELGFDKKWAEKTKIEVGSRVWKALYQQEPPIENGEVFRREWFKFYKKAPEKFDNIMQTWDTTFKKTNSSDFCAGQVWGRVGSNYYLLKRIKQRMSFTDIQRAMLRLSVEFPNARGKLVERKANGEAIIDTMQDVVGGIIPVECRDGKEIQARSVSPLFEAGNIYLPHPDIDNTIEEYVDEFCAFPNGTNDDEVDATCQYLNYDRNKNTIVIDKEIIEIGQQIKGLGEFLRSDM